MGNELNAVSNMSSRLNPTMVEPFAVRKYSALEIYNVKQGDKIRIFDFGGNKCLCVNDRPIFRLDNSFRQNQLIIYGANLTRGDIDIQGENGVATTVELRDPQNHHTYESFVIKNEQREEEGLFDIIKEAPVKAYPAVGKGSAGFKISGTW